MKWPLSFITYDLETGGLHSMHNPVLEIAFVIIDTNLNIVKKYENYIKPYKHFPTSDFPEGVPLKIEEQALRANGIKMQDVIDKGIDIKQFYKDAVAIFKEYKSGKYQKPILVGHNIASFDNPFLEVIFDLCESRKNPQISSLYNHVDKFYFDTITISRLKWGNKDDLINYQLGTVCQKMGITLTDAHRAMNDTEANAKLFIELVKGIREEKTTTNLQIGEIKEEKFRFNFQF
jgi:DNA polymerase III subunit alpha, Gram-positive type